jgi:hypothetical protein
LAWFEIKEMSLNWKSKLTQADISFNPCRYIVRYR